MVLEVVIMDLNHEEVKFLYLIRHELQLITISHFAIIEIKSFTAFYCG